MSEIIGWTSSLVLVLTLTRQVYKQWKDGSSEGVSVWLFAGQMAASTGFTIYSVLVHNWVFVVTNALMVINGIVGLTITRIQHRREDRATAGH